MKDEWEYADFQLQIDTIEFNFKPGDIQLCNKAAINQHTVDDLHRWFATKLEDVRLWVDFDNELAK